MSFHLYRINELYSNSDGSIQFIELNVGNFSGESFWQGQTITASQGGTTHSVTFQSNLPSTATANTSVLLATQGFANLGIIAPDFIISTGFLFTNGGTVNYAGVDSVTYSSLPTDGTHSVDRNGTSEVNSPKDFAGASGTVTATPTITGTSGDDSVAGGPGAHMIDGGDGIDTVSYPGMLAGFSIAKTATGYTVTDMSGADGPDTLTHVERIHFSDASLALDTSGNAGNAARLIGAAFGASHLEPALAGFYIEVFDQGYSLHDVAQAALNSDLFNQIAGSRSNQAVVQALFTNVAGHGPSADDLQHYVGLLEGGLSQADLLVAAADDDLTAEDIHLDSLSNSGMAYAPTDASALSRGTSGRDNLFGTSGNDTIDGGGATDTLYLPGNRSGYSILKTQAGLTLTSSASGTDTLANVERLQFTDKKLAFDQAAIDTAKIIGAAFGAQSLQPSLSAIGISLFDDGMTRQEVAGLAVSAISGPATNENLVNVLYTNVIGHAPDSASLKLFTDMLDQGTSKADLLLLAADTDQNAQNIGLVGIADNGLEYA